MSDQKVKKSGKEFQLILFNLGKSLYGIPIEHVQEIEKIEDITILPKAPKFIEGVINLRGNVVPVIDLRKRFGMEQTERTKKNKIVVVKVGNRLFGVIVDLVQEVLTLPEENIEPTLPTSSGLKSEFRNSIAKYRDKEDKQNLIIILEISKILQSTEDIKIQDLS